MVGVDRAVDPEFEPRSGQSKNNNIGIICCFSNSEFFPAILWREQVNFQWDDDEARSVLDQHASLDLYCVSSCVKQQCVNSDVGHSHYPDSDYQLMEIRLILIKKKKMNWKSSPLRSLYIIGLIFYPLKPLEQFKPILTNISHHWFILLA
jgi:hypothetical protein